MHCQHQQQQQQNQQQQQQNLVSCICSVAAVELFVRDCQSRVRKPGPGVTAVHAVSATTLWHGSSCCCTLLLHRTGAELGECYAVRARAQVYVEGLYEEELAQRAAAASMLCQLSKNAGNMQVRWPAC
jgi:hypothetical protein